jgi:hypothetical protein
MYYNTIFLFFSKNLDKVIKIKNAKNLRENYKNYFFNGRNRKKEKENIHIYFIYYNIMYLFFKIQKKKL